MVGDLQSQMAELNFIDTPRKGFFKLLVIGCVLCTARNSYTSQHIPHPSLDPQSGGKAGESKL